jgi:hypothetical protein
LSETVAYLGTCLGDEGWVFSGSSLGVLSLDVLSIARCLATELVLIQRIRCAND